MVGGARMTSDMTGDDGLPREPSPGVVPLGVKERVLLCVWAFVSTALYALTAVPLRGFAEELFGAAIGVAISAGVAWIAFGTSLLIVSRRYGRVSQWFDLCLRVMGWGDVALLGGGLVVLGLATLGTLWGAAVYGHIAVIAVSATTMAVLMFRGAARIGCPAWVTAIVWIGVLNGVFVVCFVALSGVLGYGEWLREVVGLAA